MVYFLILLQLADIATTHYALRTKIGTEANPLLRKLFDKFGHEPVLIVTKGAFIVFLWFAHPYTIPEVLYLLCALYVWVIWNNVSVILKGRK